MKIAVSVLEPQLESMVDERFGRARHFVIYDTQTRESHTIDNSENRNALQAAGIASAELVSGAGATVVITGHLGPKAFAALGIADIKGYAGVGMTARDAVAAFEAGSLEELTEAGESHQG